MVVDVVVVDVAVSPDGGAADVVLVVVLVSALGAAVLVAVVVVVESPLVEVVVEVVVSPPPLQAVRDATSAKLAAARAIV